MKIGLVPRIRIINKNQIEYCLEKTLESCKCEQLDAYLLHGIHKELWSNELIGFLKRIKKDNKSSEEVNWNFSGNLTTVIIFIIINI